MNKIDVYALKQGYRLITESGLNRIMSHGKYGFIIVSANRSEIHSDNDETDLTNEYVKYCQKEQVDVSDKGVMDFWLRKYNKQSDAKLHTMLKSSPYAFSKTYGGYHGTDDISDSFEPSYIVYCHSKKDSNAYLNWDALYEFGLAVCSKFKQDSIYVQAPNEAPYYVNANGSKVNSIESKNFKFNDYTQEFFTTTKRKKRTTDMNGLETPPQRFTADIQFESVCKYSQCGPSTYFERMKRRNDGEVFLDN